jgi:hypothetical protein
MKKFLTYSSYIVIATCVSIIAVSTANASYLSIACTTTATVDFDKKTVTLDYTLKNNGDEAAKDVGVSFPQLNKLLIVSQSLDATKQASGALTATFAEFGIGAVEGSYVLPFHVVYKDANYFPFSNIQLLSVATGTKTPAKQLVIKHRGEEGGLVEVSSPEKIAFTLRSIGRRDVSIRSVSFFSAQELFTKDIESSSAVPFELKGGDVAQVATTVENLNALVNSTYVTALIVEGVVDGIAFSEFATFTVKIVPGGVSQQNIYTAAVFGVLFCILVGWAVSRRRASSSRVAP